MQSFVNFIRKIIDYNLNMKEQADVNIAILGILSSLNSEQWSLCFDSTYTNKIVEFCFMVKMPPTLKAAVIKLFGYIIYLDKFRKDQKFMERLFLYIFDNLSDTNINIQIRNSWALANLCCIQKDFADPYLIQETLRTSINYAYSNKEKVIANAIRALGYLLANCNIKFLKDEVLPTINKSQVFLNKVNQ